MYEFWPIILGHTFDEAIDISGRNHSFILSTAKLWTQLGSLQRSKPLANVGFKKDPWSSRERRISQRRACVGQL